MPKREKKQKKQKKSKSEKANQEQYSYENKLCLKVLEQFVNHQYFPMFAQLKLKPRLLKHLQNLREKAETKEFTFDQFAEDLQAIFQAITSVTDHRQQIQDLKAQFRQFFSSAREFIAKRQENNTVERSVTNPSIYQSQKKPQKQKAASVQKSESKGEVELTRQMIRRKQKISTEVPIRPQNTIIKPCQIASLGYNIRKMQSQSLQYICLTFFSDKYEGESSKKGIYRLQLQKLPRREYLQLQSYVRSMLKKDCITYQMLAQEEDEDFVIETDSD